MLFVSTVCYQFHSQNIQLFFFNKNSYFPQTYFRARGDPIRKVIYTVYSKIKKERVVIKLKEGRRTKMYFSFVKRCMCG